MMFLRQITNFRFFVFIYMIDLTFETPTLSEKDSVENEKKNQKIPYNLKKKTN